MAAASSGAALLGGCGFQLRQAPRLPFGRIALAGFAAQSPMAAALRQQIEASAQVVTAVQNPEVILQALDDRREKRSAGTTAAGQVRELQLRVVFEFRLTTAGGQELLPRSALSLARDISYSESIALAKEQEEAQLYAAMEADIVMQVLRRVAQAPRKP